MTRATPMPGELVWDHATADIPEAGLMNERTAEPGECDKIARALDLVTCSLLTVAYSITPSGSGRFRLTGNVHARVEQACVVTLEPVASTIAEPIDVCFWPADAMPQPTSGEVDLDGDDDPEPILDGRIAVGRVVCECLAAAMDPFPRKPDAALDKHSTGSDAEAGANPFAVLAQLRTKG